MYHSIDCLSIHHFPPKYNKISHRAFLTSPAQTTHIPTNLTRSKQATTLYPKHSASRSNCLLNTSAPLSGQHFIISEPEHQGSMCILTIRSWPCGHSRCTSTDVCMDALSMPGTAPYDCPFATHSFQRQASRDWPCPICHRRRSAEQGSHERDPGSLPASMSPRKMQQQAFRLQRAAQQQQGQRAADLRRASQQLQQDWQSIGLPPLLASVAPLHDEPLPTRPASSSTRHDAEDLTSASSDTTSSSSSPATSPYAEAAQPLWSDRTNAKMHASAFQATQHEASPKHD